MSEEKRKAASVDFAGFLSDDYDTETTPLCTCRSVTTVHYAQLRSRAEKEEDGTRNNETLVTASAPLRLLFYLEVQKASADERNHRLGMQLLS